MFACHDLFEEMVRLSGPTILRANIITIPPAYRRSNVRSSNGSATGQTRPVPPVLPTPRLPLCLVSDRDRAAAQYVAKGHKQTCQSLQSAARQWADAKRLG